ncbi:MAG: substrate-binding domain-containing protein [Phycisphaerales bacterium]|jgi:DNA-binding LacI/PurR family transcriptional regulator|nr:substrate-binding domain-containing protein [Phycisphaerales bacterium]
MSDTAIGTRSRNLARWISQSIERGDIAIGSYLPSTRTLASQHGVSLGTVQVALRELETQNIVECLPRRGAKVRRVPSGTPAVPADASTVSRSKAHLIGIAGMRIDSYLPTSWGHHIVRAFEKHLFDAHFTMAQLPWYESDGDLNRIMCGHLDRLGDSLAGVLTWNSPELDEVTAELDRRGIPWLTISRPHKNRPLNFVEADNLGSMRLVGKCCAQSGAHRVVYLTTALNEAITAMDKATGFYQGFLDAGVSTRDIEVLSVNGVMESDGYQAIREYLARVDQPPQAVVAFGDLLAVGAERALHQAGLRVPEQVAVIGGTGSIINEQAHKTIGVVAQPMDQMGHTAADMMLEMIRTNQRRILGRTIHCQLDLRHSLSVSAELADEISQYNAAGEAISESSPDVRSNPSDTEEWTCPLETCQPA